MYLGDVKIQTLSTRLARAFWLVLGAIIGVACLSPAYQPKNSAAEQMSNKTNQDLQQLAAAEHSLITESFVFVARDGESYATLRAVLNTLPEQTPEFFSSNAVVAVFLGQRRTGGYGIEISRENSGPINIIERKPPKGAMLKMVLTAPQKVVAVSIGPDEPLNLSLGETWKERLREFRLTSGEVTVSGGFAGRSESAQLQGNIQVMSSGELVTLLFEVDSLSPRAGRRLNDVSSGKISSAGKITLSFIDSFPFTGAVNSPFRATGELSEAGKKLLLTLETSPRNMVSDNYSGRVTINSTSTSPEKATP